MKPIVVVLSIASLCFQLAACSGDQAGRQKSDAIAIALKYLEHNQIDPAGLEITLLDHSMSTDSLAVMPYFRAYDSLNLKKVIPQLEGKRFWVILCRDPGAVGGGWYVFVDSASKEVCDFLQFE